MLRQRLTKRQLVKITTILTEKLFERCHVKNTPAANEVMSIELRKIQQEMSFREGNPIWTIPFQIKFDDFGNLNLLPDENHILILDFDS